MDPALDALAADPTDETLEAAKQAWLAARDDYGLTEAFRFYGGPIDNEDDGPEGLINAWPLDEAYVDYVEGDETAGIINDPQTYPTIDADRRATYLTVAGGLLIEHLTGLADAWAPDADNYRAEFVALDPDEALTRIVTGIGEVTRGELAGERMFVAYSERSQEDEHSR